MQARTQPESPVAGQKVILLLKVFDATGNESEVREFDVVNNQLMRLVITGAGYHDLRYPQYKDYGLFIDSITLPRPGKYLLEATYHPRNGNLTVMRRHITIG